MDGILCCVDFVSSDEEANTRQTKDRFWNTQKSLKVTKLMWNFLQLIKKKATKSRAMSLWFWEIENEWLLCSSAIILILKYIP